MLKQYHSLSEENDKTFNQCLKQEELKNISSELKTSKLTGENGKEHVGE